MGPEVGISLAEPASSSGVRDGSLIAAAQAGDRDAFDTLLRGRLDRTFRTARAILGNESDASDAIQDAWLAVWRQLPGLRESGAFDGWVDRIVVNACRTHLRARSRVHEIPMAPGFEEPDLSLGERPEAIAERQVLEHAFEQLSIDQRAVLVLHHLQHQPVAVIAASLGIPEGTVKWRLHAARAALAAAMEADR